MNADPCCPVCEADDWEVLGARTYDRSCLQAADEYVGKRLQVLFDVWHPDQPQVTNESCLCRTCGMLIYRPRPSEDDLDRKYWFLASLEADQNQAQITPEREAARAERMWKKMAGSISKRPARVLDFGGGDGRLVVPFARHGHNCFVVDYAPTAVEGVTRLGSTLDEVDESEPFEVVICSHVIEHVADPCGVLARLRRHMTQDGTIYVEVPMEIWRRPPLQEEPVTHVNFFAVNSLRSLLQRAGFAPVSVRMEDYPHPLGHRTIVVSAIGTNQPEGSARVEYRGAAETRRLLNPGWSDRVQRALLRPQALPAAIWNKVKQRGVVR